MISLKNKSIRPSISLIAGVCASSVLVYAAVISAPTASFATQDSQDVLQALNALGLNADSMACIDVTGNEPTTVLNRLNDEFDDYEQYLTIQRSIADHQKTVYQAKAILRDYASDADAQSALELAEGQVTLLTSQAEAVKDALIDTLLEGVADASLISPVIEAQGLVRRLPPAYRIAVDTADEAKTLAWALKKQETAQENGTTLNSDASQALSSAHAQFEVQHALVRVSTFGASNQAKIDSWVAGN